MICPKKEAILLVLCVINKTVTPHVEVEMMRIYFFLFIAARRIVMLLHSALCYYEFCNELHCQCCLIILSK